MYLLQILQKYQARDLTLQSASILQLQNSLQTWVSSCYIEILKSGSRAKGTAISLASDVDYLVSLKSNCNENTGGLKSIYDYLFNKLDSTYKNVRKQNVSVRINLNGLEIDITPARKQAGNTNDHWLYLSKLDTRKQTNIQKHIYDISSSGRTNEIKLIKIWRELNKLEFPSIYLEYLIVDKILLNKPKNEQDLVNNVWFILNEFAGDIYNPLYKRIVDPANSANILSDLLNQTEKGRIIYEAKKATQMANWNQIIW